MIIEKLRDFISTCPYFGEESRINVNYIGVDMSYSVDPLPCTPIIKRYTDGGTMKQFQFQLSSKELYDEDARINIENSGFYENFAVWLEHAKMDELDEHKKPNYFEVLNSGYLYDVDGNKARYAIECRLIYEEEAIQWQK